MAKTERLEIRAEDKFISSLEQLAQASGTSKADIIHRAVGLYAQALKEVESKFNIGLRPINPKFFIKLLFFILII